MKKLFTLIASLMLLSACSSKVEIQSLATEYIGTPTTPNNNIYKYENLDRDKCAAASVKLKEKIDKELGMLPTEIGKAGVRSTGHICENYEWETPERFVSLWIDFTANEVEIIDRAK